MIRRTLLEVLIRPLAERLGERWVGAILFGSAIRYLDREDPPLLADVNLALVVDRYDLAVAEAVRPLLAHRDLEMLRVVVLAEPELARTLATFPVEARELRARRVLLHGRDPFVGAPDLAADLEHQVAFEVHSKRAALRSLLAGTAPTDHAVGVQLLGMGKAFAPLARSLLRARGVAPPPSKEELLVLLVERFGLPVEGAEALRDLQATHEDRRRPASREKRAILEAFLLAWDWLASMPRIHRRRSPQAPRRSPRRVRARRRARRRG